MQHCKPSSLTALASSSYKSENVQCVAVGSIWITLIALLWLNLQASIAQCQENRSTVDQPTVEDALIAALNWEKDHGTYTFYRQAYTDSDNRKAIYAGSIYGSITAFRVLDCVVNLEVAVIDHFSGTINSRPTGEQQDSTTYAVTFPVNQPIAENLVLLDARPVELSASTHAICTERPACTFTWLEIRGSRGEIKETQIVNEILSFKGSAKHFLIPLSSTTSGNRLVQALRTLAHEKCR
jgi:hypothetical protein